MSVIGVLLYRDYRLRAGPEEVPQDARESDVTERAVVISWITPDADQEGWIQWSETPGISSGSPLSLDDRDVISGNTEKWTTHYITLSELQPETKYYFVIGSGSNSYKDVSGSEFTFTTPAMSSDSIPTPDPIFGTVENGDEQKAIVYVILENASGEKSFPVSALTNDGGNFEVDLSHIRDETLESLFRYDESTIMYIFAQGGDLGGAVAELTVADSDDIVLVLEKGITGDSVMPEFSKINVAGDLPCESECEGKDCGGDGCGGTCGSCDDDETCSNSGVCEVCEPDCEGKDCGDDGCGGICGTCDNSEVCNKPGVCSGCEPDCTGKACGDNGCGGSCGTCSTGKTCSTSGVCVEGACQPDCDGRNCGNDGCGGSCGICGTGTVCTISGVCAAEVLAPSSVRDVQLTHLLDSGGIAFQSEIEGVKITNISENSFSVVWTSSNQEIGSVFYGESVGSLSSSARDTRDSLISQYNYYTHHVSVTNLVPETRYLYEIHSGSQVFNDNGKPFEFTTPAIQSSPPAFYSIFGKIVGTGQSDAVVTGRILASGNASALVSCEVVNGGNWSLSLGGVRTEDYVSYFTFTDSSSIELTVRTKGNAVTETYVLSEIEDVLVETNIDMIDSSGGSFDRGLYSEIMDKLDDLPLTAVNRVTAVGLTVSVVLIVVGSYLFLGARAGGKNEQWEKNFLHQIDDE